MPDESLPERMYRRLSEELDRLVREERLPGLRCEIHLDGMEHVFLFRVLGNTSPGCRVKDDTLEGEILRVLRESKKPLKASAVAVRCKRKLDARLKIILAALNHVGLIGLGEEGYSACGSDNS